MREEKQTERLERTMQEIRDCLSSQLVRVEKNQTMVNEQVTSLKMRCDGLQNENGVLRKELDEMKQKCDSLENHSRRNNLLFFGIGKERDRKETWDDCERPRGMREVGRGGRGNGAGGRGGGGGGMGGGENDQRLR